MSTDMTCKILCTDSGDTESFGERLGKRLRGGEVIELTSDLGGGKTTLTRGIVRGAGSQDIVGSPTFTVSKLYKTADFDIHHFDFYRLENPGVMAYELHDLLLDKQAVIIIEWSKIVEHILPAERVRIMIHKTNDGSRELVCHYPPTLGYLFSD